VRRVLQGVQIAAAPGLAEDLCRSLLGALEPGDPGEPPDLVITARPSEAPVPPAPGGRPIFFHGVLRGSEHAGAVRVTDGSSSVEISADGRAIDGTVHVAARGERPFDHVLLAVALAIALRSRGLYHLHAAALVAPGGGVVLVPGAGGAGKTTLALALAARGFAPIADDLCFLTRRGGAPAIVPVRRAFHVAERTAEAFPALAPLLGAPVPSGKRELDPVRAFGAPPPGRLGLPATLLFPEVTGGPRTMVAPMEPEAAFDALLASSALVVVDAMPGAAEHLALLGEVLRSACALRVQLAEDLLRDTNRAARTLAREVLGS
jgi:hypothetical protein